MRRRVDLPLLGAALWVAWVLLLKVHLLRLRGGVGWTEVPVLVLPDTAIACLLLAVAVAAGRYGGRTGRVAGAVLLGAAALLAGLSYGLLLKKGSRLDWSLLAYTIANLGELRPLLRSELRPVDAVLFVAPPVILVLRLLPRSRKSVRWVAPAVLAGLAALAWAGDGVAGPRSEPAAFYRQALLGPFLRVGGRAAVRPLEILPAPSRLYADWDSRPPEGPRPNLIVVLMESVRASATTPYPPRLPATPFLARAAREGLLVEDAYCLIPHTSKSLLTIFTGHPPQLRLERKKTWALPGGALPRLLGDLGYRSAFFEPATERFEERRLLIEGLGFDEYHPAEDIAGSFEKTHYFGYEDGCLVQPVVDWVARGHGQPFLLAMINLGTHHDYVAPKTWKPVAFDVRDPPPQAERFQLYLNMVRHMDEVLEDMFARLGAGGYLDDTVVFFLGDHGEAFGEHGQDGHLDVIWQEAIRIPMIVRGPRRYLGAPRRIHGLRQVVDVLPTIADILGVPNQWRTTSAARGVSLLAPPIPDRRLFVSSWYQGGDMALVGPERKYLWFAVQDRLACFDLRRDPGERQDLGPSLAAAGRDRIVDRMLGFRAGVHAWYLAAEAAEVRSLRVAVLPSFENRLDADFGGLRVAGCTHPGRAWETAFFDVVLGFEVAAAPAPSTRLVLAARRGTELRPVESVRDLDRLPPERWGAGARILLRQQVRIAAPGEWNLVLQVLGPSGPLPVHPAGRAERHEVDLGRIRILPR